MELMLQRKMPAACPGDELVSSTKEKGEILNCLLFIFSLGHLEAAAKIKWLAALSVMHTEKECRSVC